MEGKTVFYMVFVEGGTAPNTKHESKELAHAEAERLCKKIGKDTYVLKSVVYLKTKAEVTKHIKIRAEEIDKEIEKNKKILDNGSDIALLFLWSVCHVGSIIYPVPIKFNSVCY